MKTIRELRAAKDITQEDLSHALGVTVTTISMYENQKIRPSERVLTSMAAYFECRVTDIIVRPFSRPGRPLPPIDPVRLAEAIEAMDE